MLTYVSPTMNESKTDWTCSTIFIGSYKVAGYTPPQSVTRSECWILGLGRDSGH